MTPPQPAPPSRPPAEVGTTLAVALGAFLVLLPGVFWGLPSSKGIVGGLRVLDGEVPYRDFWSMYAPGQFYAVAGLFAAFGERLIVQGVAAVLVRALSAAVLLRILRRLGIGRVGAALIAAAFVGASFDVPVDLESYGPAQLGLLVALWRVLAYFQGGRGADLVAAGLALGLAASFKHDVAAYAALGTTAALVLAPVLVARRPAAWLPAGAAVLRLALGCAITVLPVVAALALAAGADAWRDLIVFPATDFRAVRGQGWPGWLPDVAAWRAWLAEPGDLYAARRAADTLSWWIVARFPELAFAAGATWLALRGRRARLDRAALGVLALTAMPFYWAAAHVQANTHVVTLAILAAVVLGAARADLRERAPQGAAPRRRPALALRAAGALLAGLWTLGLWIPSGLELYPALSAWRRLGWPAGVPLSFPMAEGVVVSPRERDFFEPVVGFLREHLEEGERFHAGLESHATVVVGNQRFYLLSQRRPATRYNELHPGVVDHEDVQKEMIADLERHAVRCVVLWDFGGANPDFSPAKLAELRARRQERVPGTGADLLDRYIDDTFEELFRAGEYRVLWRIGLPRPAGA